MIFRYTILYVDDVPAALDFYAKAFGAKIGFVHDGQDYGELVTGQTNLAFAAHALQAELGKTPARADAAHPTFGLGFEVEDVAACYAQAVAAGARGMQSPKTESWGQVTSFVADPFGYVIELCSAVQLPNPD